MTWLLDHYGKDFCCWLYLAWVAGINPFTAEFSQENKFFNRVTMFLCYDASFGPNLLLKHFFALQQHFDRDSV